MGADPQRSGQGKALARLCKNHSMIGFFCNPSGGLLLDEQEILSYMGVKILDSQIQALKVEAMMLSSNGLHKSQTMVDTHSSFSHAVLVRLATQAERDEQEAALSLGPEDHLECLELVRFANVHQGTAWFIRTGIKEFYIQ